MKTTLATALVLFVLYLAGCDFLGSNEGLPSDGPPLETQARPSEPEWTSLPGPLYSTTDTTTHGN